MIKWYLYLMPMQYHSRKIAQQHYKTLQLCWNVICVLPDTLSTAFWTSSWSSCFLTSQSRTSRVFYRAFPRTQRPVVWVLVQSWMNNKTFEEWLGLDALTLMHWPLKITVSYSMMYMRSSTQPLPAETLWILSKPTSGGLHTSLQQ